MWVLPRSRRGYKQNHLRLTPGPKRGQAEGVDRWGCLLIKSPDGGAGWTMFQRVWTHKKKLIDTQSVICTYSIWIVAVRWWVRPPPAEFWGIMCFCFFFRLHLKISIFIHISFAGGISDLWDSARCRHSSGRGDVSHSDASTFDTSRRNGCFPLRECEKRVVVYTRTCGREKSHTWGQFLLLQASQRAEKKRCEWTVEWNHFFFNTHSRVKRLQKPPWAFSVSLGSEHKRACWFSSLARGNAFAFHNLQMDGLKITLPHRPGWHSQRVNRGAINGVI